MKKGTIFLIIFLVALVIILALFGLKVKSDVILQGEVEVKQVDLSSKVPGRILKIDVKKGDKVEKGQLLITLDTPDILAKSKQTEGALKLALAQQQKLNAGARKEQLQIAKATYSQAVEGFALAQKTYNRMKNLYDEGVIPAQKLDEAYSAYKRAEGSLNAAKSAYEMAKNGAQKEDKLMAAANVNRAKAMIQEAKSYLDETQIKSPINGEVVDIIAEESELIGSGYPIISIIDLSDVWVVFNIREDLLTKIKMGTEFDATFPAIGKKPIKLKVNYISAMGNFASWRATKSKGDFDLKTFEVRAVPTESVEGLRAGMTALINWNKIK